MSLGAPAPGGRVPADADELRRELRDIRGRLARIEAWRQGLRNMLARARACDPSELADLLHDAMDDGAPDLTPRRSLHVDTPTAGDLSIDVPIDQRPTDRIPRAPVIRDRPGLEQEIDDGA